MTVEPPEPSASFYRKFSQWAHRVGLARKLAVALAVAAIASGVATYVALTSAPPLGSDPELVLVLLNIDLVLLLLLGALVCRHLVRTWAERRRRSAGSRLMTRLVLLFSVVAAGPVIVVALFSVLFFDLGIKAWFSERVRTALSESLAVTAAYLDEHQHSIRSDVLAMAAEFNRRAPILVGNPAFLKRELDRQTAILALPEAIVFSETGGPRRILASSGLSFALQYDTIPEWALEKARVGEVVILTGPDEDRFRALVRLERYLDTFLYVGRLVEANVVGHVQRTEEAVQEYQRLEGESSGFRISFFMLYAMVALLLLVAAVWLGLMFATQIARPISALIAAAERIRMGDLSARVGEGPEGDELGTLSRAFNRMTDQLEAQRGELVEAHRQVDERRRFTETVLAGVSAGVIGLDGGGRINLPNRSASELLSTDVDLLRGQELASAVPEMADLIEATREKPDRLVQSEIKIVRGGRARMLLVRITAERDLGRIIGYVVTFDDITELLAAQRKAAWSDVARRIAHEIKNPLTPIQLSAERLKRKYQDEVTSDPDIFETCTDTIIRHVGDIGRMVDEFSAFARMPAPVMKREDLCRLTREAVFLQTSANSAIDYRCELPDAPLYLRCDGRQIGQVLTNLLQNAADSILDQLDPSDKKAGRGLIVLATHSAPDGVRVEVTDNGKGIPLELRDRLTEPYVTTRIKGTGLGLAIVKKIMEDHNGDLILENLEEGGARVTITFPAAAAESDEASEDQIDESGQEPEELEPVKKTATHGA